VFRGINSIEHLCPAIIRSFENRYTEKNTSSKINSHSTLIEKYEIDMLHRFEINASYNLDHVSSVFDFIATMRHYELPTRMIDWTRNPYTAVLFAIFNNNKNEELSNQQNVCVSSQKKNDESQTDCVTETDGFDFNNYYYVLWIDISKHVRFYDIPCLVDSAVKQNYIMHDLPYTTKYIYMFETIRKLFSDSNDNQRRKLIKFIFENTNSEYLFNVIHDNKKQVAKMNGYIE